MRSLRPLAVIAISLVFILTPFTAKADEILIELTPEITYVDTVVEVTTPTEYFIETFTGVRMEQAANGAVTQRTGWVDSWIELRQGEVILRADDDSNHVTGVNEYASKIIGTVNTGTYTIRATSYLNRVANVTPTGNYTLNSNLINVPVIEPIPEPTPPPAPEPVAPPIFIDYQPVAPEPPAPAQEPPVVIPDPIDAIGEPPIEPEAPPVIEEPPAPVEEPPAQVEEPPTPVEEAPSTVEEAVADVIAEADGEAITAEAIAEAGLTLEDLPSSTPVEVRTDENGNAVVITAEVAVALQVFDSPTELVSAIFNNPGQVLTAVANIGADMSDEERKESEEIIVASVIASQAAINAAGMAAGTATRIPTPSSPSGGPLAGNDKPRSTRRREP